jgi:beta-glucosidase
MKAYRTSRVAGLALLGLVSVYSLAIRPTRGADPIETIGAVAPATLKEPVVSGPETWKDPAQPVEARVADLLRRMSPAEKAAQLRADAAAIPGLFIPAYSYRNECAHGVARAGVATVFPQTIGMAATWDAPLMGREADVIATEARAKHNDYLRTHDGQSGMHYGLSFYTPNINIVRDPRWGRGQETYGEDPFLTAQIAVAFIRGLQGDDAKYVKAMACAKHFAVHSGPEAERHRFNATPTERDLYETYLPAFEAAIRQGQAGSVMGAYSALYGKPACASPFLLTDLLRQKWGFTGFVVSDGGAIGDIWQQHKYVATPEAAAAVAVKAGCDLFSGTFARGVGGDYQALGKMLQRDLLSEKEIDTAVGRTLAARFRLGLFDPPSLVPWSKLTLADNDTPEHQALALEVARESIVLLKNNGALPLNRARIKRIAVIGANADSEAMLLGNYSGTPSHSVTLLAGIKEKAGSDIEVTYEKGCPLALKKDGSNKPTTEMTARAVAAAKAADVVIYIGGLDASLEREEDAVDRPPAPGARPKAGGNRDARVGFEGFYYGDRTRIELPPVQTELLRALHATGKPVVLVNCSGSAIAMPWEAEHLPAIVQAWYPGQAGGTAVADVLFGDANPAGRMPVTCYRSTADLPPFADYSMSNRTYRYFSGKPLYAFGHGLSYTEFAYSDAKLASAAVGPKDTAKLTFTLKNTGPRDGAEVAQVYFRHVHSVVPQAKLALCGFTRIHLAPGETTKVALDIPAARFRYWNTTQKQYVVEPGQYELLIGGASDNIRLRAQLKVLAAP